MLPKFQPLRTKEFAKLALSMSSILVIRKRLLGQGIAGKIYVHPPGQPAQLHWCLDVHVRIQGNEGRGLGDRRHDGAPA